MITGIPKRGLFDRDNPSGGETIDREHPPQRPTKAVVTERPRRQTLWPRKMRELTAHFDEVASLAGALVWKSNHHQSVASLIMVVITVGGM